MFRIVRKVFIIIICVVLLFEIVIYFSGKWYINRTLSLTIFSGKLGPGIEDLNNFPKHEIKAGKPQPWPLSSAYNKKNPGKAILDYSSEMKSVALLVIRNDSILYEKYWGNFSDASLSNSFSMAKSLNAALIGVAIHEGKIRSVDEPVGDFLPEFREGDKSRITIRHLLTMSSGLNFWENYINPLAWPAEAYYGADVNALTLNAMPVMPAGKKFHYKGGDSQLLGMILKAATGKNIADYASEKLWIPMGAEHTAYWSTDEKGMEKVSCCWYTDARDFARLARLYMNFGNWNGTQLIDSSYVLESITPASILDEDDQPLKK